jgi:transposase
LVVDGVINGTLFLADVEPHLVSTLHEGDVVIRAHLSSHKRGGVREAMESVGATLLF